MALRVLAHFVPGKVLDFLAPESDWLDIRWCADDDDTGFYRELPDAQVIRHVLRPLSGADLRRGVRLRLVHKGCTVGLVGYGNIAKRVGGIVAAMGATVLHTSTCDDGRPGWRQLPELSPASGRCPQAPATSSRYTCR